MISPLIRSLAVCSALTCAVCSCSTVPPTEQPKPVTLAAPAELGDCTLTLTGVKTGSTTPGVYKMGYAAPMPKLKIFSYIPRGESADISFDGVGDGCAVHFNGTLRTVSQTGNTYQFEVAGEMKGFDPEPFEATPTGITITLNPNE